MQAGEIMRRVAFDLLDRVHGGRLNQLKKVNMREILEGITPEYEARRLDAIMDHAEEHSAFYRAYPGLMDGEGADAAPEDRIRRYPVMNKTDYIQNFDRVLCDAWQEGGEKTYRLSTSGSTGAPFTVLCDSAKMDRINMNFISFMELNGFRMGMKRGEFRVWIEGKNTISRWKSWKNNLLMIDIAHMGDEALQAICDRIRKQKIQVLVSYSSALTALGGYIRRRQIDVSKWSVEMIFSMGEALPDDTFELLTELFGFSPVRSYGNNENGFIAVGLGDQKTYTLDLYNFYVEMLKLDSDEPAAPGEPGRIVVTDYYNRAFPMIRYDTGDTGIMEVSIDGKGRKHAIFREIYGRRGSLLYSCSGEPLSIHVFMNVLLHQEGIVHQAKCIQWEKKRYEILLNADRSRLNEKELTDAYRRYLGAEAVIDVTYVDEIPVQASGKRMVCENRCPDYV